MSDRGTTIGALILSIISVPVVWWFAVDAIPSLGIIRTEVAGNRFGPWLFTWALVWVTTFSALALAWVAYSVVKGQRDSE